MPDLGQFLSAFGLTVGNTIGGYVITGVTGSEQSITRYREYSYRIIVRLSHIGISDTSQFLPQFNSLIGQRLNVKAIRNYYLCTIDPINSDDIAMDNAGHLSIFLTGHATR